jgi:hypothetical protein
MEERTSASTQKRPNKGLEQTNGNNCQREAISMKYEYS